LEAQSQKQKRQKEERSSKSEGEEEGEEGIAGWVLFSSCCITASILMDRPAHVLFLLSQRSWTSLLASRNAKQKRQTDCPTNPRISIPVHADISSRIMTRLQQSFMLFYGLFCF